MTEAIEITTFKLAKGCTCENFIVGNRDVDRWLERQPGFRSRRIAQRNDGTVVDMLLWASADDAESSMHRLMYELRNSPVHALIDQHTVSWTVATVFHSIDM
jgi:hypothetical protein